MSYSYFLNYMENDIKEAIQRDDTNKIEKISNISKELDAELNRVLKEDKHIDDSVLELNPFFKSYRETLSGDTSISASLLTPYAKHYEKMMDYLKNNPNALNSLKNHLSKIEQRDIAHSKEFNQIKTLINRVDENILITSDMVDESLLLSIDKELVKLTTKIPNTTLDIDKLRSFTYVKDYSQLANKENLIYSFTHSIVTGDRVNNLSQESIDYVKEVVKNLDIYASEFETKVQILSECTLFEDAKARALELSKGVSEAEAFVTQASNFTELADALNSHNPEIIPTLKMEFMSPIKNKEFFIDKGALVAFNNYLLEMDKSEISSLEDIRAKGLYYEFMDFLKNDNKSLTGLYKSDYGIFNFFNPTELKINRIIGPELNSPVKEKLVTSAKNLVNTYEKNSNEKLDNIKSFLDARMDVNIFGRIYEGFDFKEILEINPDSSAENIAVFTRRILGKINIIALLDKNNQIENSQNMANYSNLEKLISVGRELLKKIDEANLNKLDPNIACDREKAMWSKYVSDFQNEILQVNYEIKNSLSMFNDLNSRVDELEFISNLDTNIRDLKLSSEFETGIIREANSVLLADNQTRRAISRTVSNEVLQGRADIVNTKSSQELENLNEQRKALRFLNDSGMKDFIDGFSSDIPAKEADFKDISAKLSKMGSILKSIKEYDEYQKAPNGQAPQKPSDEMIKELISIHQDITKYYPKDNSFAVDYYTPDGRIKTFNNWTGNLKARDLARIENVFIMKTLDLKTAMNDLNVHAKRLLELYEANKIDASMFLQKYKKEPGMHMLTYSEILKELEEEANALYNATSISKDDKITYDLLKSRQEQILSKTRFNDKINDNSDILKELLDKHLDTIKDNLANGKEAFDSIDIDPELIFSKAELNEIVTRSMSMDFENSFRADIHATHQKYNRLKQKLFSTTTSSSSTDDGGNPFLLTNFGSSGEATIDNIANQRLKAMGDVDDKVAVLEQLREEVKKELAELVETRRKLESFKKQFEQDVSDGIKQLNDEIDAEIVADYNKRCNDAKAYVKNQFGADFNLINEEIEKDGVTLSDDRINELLDNFRELGTFVDPKGLEMLKRREDRAELLVQNAKYLSDLINNENSELHKSIKEDLKLRAYAYYANEYFDNGEFSEKINKNVPANTNELNKENIIQASVVKFKELFNQNPEDNRFRHLYISDDNKDFRADYLRNKDKIERLNEDMTINRDFIELLDKNSQALKDLQNYINSSKDIKANLKEIQKLENIVSSFRTDFYHLNQKEREAYVSQALTDDFKKDYETMLRLGDKDNMKEIVSSKIMLSNELFEAKTQADLNKALGNKNEIDDDRNMFKRGVDFISDNSLRAARALYKNDFIGSIKKIHQEGLKTFYDLSKNTMNLYEVPKSPLYVVNPLNHLLMAMILAQLTLSATRTLGGLAVQGGKKLRNGLGLDEKGAFALEKNKYLNFLEEKQKTMFDLLNKNEINPFKDDSFNFSNSKFANLKKDLDDMINRAFPHIALLKGDLKLTPREVSYANERERVASMIKELQGKIIELNYSKGADIPNSIEESRKMFLNVAYTKLLLSLQGQEQELNKIYKVDDGIKSRTYYEDLQKSTYEKFMSETPADLAKELNYKKVEAVGQAQLTTLSLEKEKNNAGFTAIVDKLGDFAKLISSKVRPEINDLGFIKELFEKEFAKEKQAGIKGEFSSMFLTSESGKSELNEQAFLIKLLRVYNDKATVLEEYLNNGSYLDANGYSDKNKEVRRQYEKEKAIDKYAVENLISLLLASNAKINIDDAIKDAKITSSALTSWIITANNVHQQREADKKRRGPAGHNISQAQAYEMGM